MITKRVFNKLTNETGIKSMNIVGDTLQITIFDKTTNEAKMEKYSLCKLSKMAKLWAVKQDYNLQTRPYMSEGTVYWEVTLYSPDKIRHFSPTLSEEQGVFFVCEWIVEFEETGKDLRK